MKLKFRVTGMTCAACSARVEKVTKGVSGVTKAEVNLLAGTLTVEADTDAVCTPIIDKIKDAGYGASVYTKEKAIPKETGISVEKRLLFSGIFLVVLMYFTMGHMIGLPVPFWYHGNQNGQIAALLQLLLTLPILMLNASYYRNGIRTLWNLSPNMDTLIAIGSGAAFVYSIFAMFCIAYGMGYGDWDLVEKYRENLYFESAAMIVTLVTLGKYLESRAKGKTTNALEKLMDLRPNSATIKENGKERSVPIDQVKTGDVLILRSGSSVPVDGKVIYGQIFCDQSAITGESIPVEKLVEDPLIAGTICTQGYAEMVAEKVGEDTTLSQIVKLVEDASGSKAPIARVADKVAGIFVPVVLTVAAVTFTLWMLFGAEFTFALTKAISVLVISCPCAMGLATPVAIMVATGRGARMGVLYKNAEALERLHTIDTVVLDKTGTLTEGKPVVTDVITNGIPQQELLQIAVSLETYSEHPLAAAILDYGKNCEILPVLEFQTLPGQGISAIINGKRCFAGNRRLLENLSLTVPEYSEFTQQGRTPLYFAFEDRFLGAIAVADTLKTDSPDAVRMMQKQRLDVIMLTGDNETTAKAIAGKAGISNVISDVMPQDKAQVISDLRRKGHKVLMVGDGINDAPALVTADVGMAIGSGTDIAIESADVVLMGNSLRAVSDAIRLSRATITNIKQNLFWAFFYNALGIPIAAGALYTAFGIGLSPMLGAAAMSLSSVFVVTNALRLGKFKGSITDKREIKKMERIIYVDGMMCTHCKARVENVCKGIAGVESAEVNLEKKYVAITGNGDVDQIKKAITEAGYEVKK